MRQTYTEDFKEIQTTDIISMIESTIEISAEIEDEFIETINMLTNAGKKSVFAMGALFAKREKIIKDKYFVWSKSQKDPKERLKKLFGDNPAPPKSLYEWYQRLDERPEGAKKLMVSYPQAQNYIAIFESGMPEDVAEKIGTRKYSVIRTLPEPEQEKVIQQTIVNNWTANEVREYVTEIKGKVENRERRKEEKKRETKRIIKEIRIDQITKGGKITLIPYDFDVEYLQEALSTLDATIKRLVKEAIERNKK